MADCELLPGCLFFNDKMASMPATAQLMKNSYCRGNNDACARYAVYLELGRSRVPPDLIPTQMQRAKELIALK